MAEPTEHVKQSDPEFIVRIEGTRARFEVVQGLAESGLRWTDASHRLDDITDARSEAADQFFIAVTARREDLLRCIEGEGPGAKIIAELPGRITRYRSEADGTQPS